MKFCKRNSTYIIISFLLLAIHPLLQGQSKDVLAEGEVVYDIQFNAKGSRIFLTVKNEVQCWDVDSRQLVHAFSGIHEGKVFALDLRQEEDKQLLLSAGTDQKVVVYDLEGNTVLNSNLVSTGNVTAASFLNRNRVVIGTDASELIVWDFVTNQTEIIHGHKVGITALTFNSEQNILASSDQKGQIIVWDTNKLKQLSVNYMDESHIRALSFSKDGDVLLSGNDRSKVSHWYQKNTEFFYHSKSDIGKQWVTSLDIISSDKENNAEDKQKLNTSQRGFSYATGGTEKVLKVYMPSMWYEKGFKRYIHRVKFRPSDSPYLQVAVATHGKGVYFVSLKEMKVNQYYE